MNGKHFFINNNLHSNIFTDIKNAFRLFNFVNDPNNHFSKNTSQIVELHLHRESALCNEAILTLSI